MQDTKVIDSRLVDETMQVRRRRECLKCKERFTTYETPELNLPRVIKRDGRRSQFDVQKVRAGLLKALEKRPVQSEKIETAIQHVIRKLHVSGEREVTSEHVGELVMDELRALDEVAYVRFASVYRSFQDVEAFQKEIRRLQKKALKKQANKNFPNGSI